MYKTSRLVRISLLINALNKRVLLFFLGKLFYKSNRKLFSCVCISWYKHSRGWENSRQLCKPSTSSRVCITVSNSPNPSRVYIRLCKHGKRFPLLNYIIWADVSAHHNLIGKHASLTVCSTSFGLLESTCVASWTIILWTPSWKDTQSSPLGIIFLTSAIPAKLTSQLWAGHLVDFL